MISIFRTTKKTTTTKNKIQVETNHYSPFTARALPPPYFTWSDRGDRGELVAEWLLACVGNFRGGKRTSHPLRSLSKHCEGAPDCLVYWETPRGDCVQLWTRLKSIKKIRHLSPQTCCLCCQTREAQRSLLDHLQDENIPINRTIKHTMHRNVIKREQMVHLLFDVSTLMYSHVNSVL